MSKFRTSNIISFTLCTCLSVCAPAYSQEIADLEERIAELEATAARCSVRTEACLVEPNTLADIKRLQEQGLANLPVVQSNVDQKTEAAAVAAALHDPDLSNGEKFGIRIDWGGIEGENALGFSGAATLMQRTNSRFAVSGGVGVGLEHDQVGGHVGGQLTWK